MTIQDQYKEALIKIRNEQVKTFNKMSWIQTKYEDWFPEKQNNG